MAPRKKYDSERQRADALYANKRAISAGETRTNHNSEEYL
jgi:hypothetical protein